MSALLTPTMFGKTLRDNRRVFTVWATASGLLAMLYASFYPQLTNETVADIPQAMRGFGLDDVTTAAGYLQGAVFGLLLPLLATFYGAATGARMISSDEESGYLDLLLAHPISRTHLLLHRFSALCAGASLIAAAVLAALLTIRSNAELDSISIGELAAQTLSLALLAVFFGALATTMGAAARRSRATVFGATAALGVTAYAMHGFAPQIGADWLRRLTPYHYYIGGEPLKNGIQPTDAAVLASGTIILITLGVWLFNRRDLA